MNRILILLVTAAMALPALAWKPLLVGHRGCNIGVENTIEAFANGVDIYHYDGLECDVRVTADGKYVISHDEFTTRVGGNLMVSDATLAELQAEQYVQQRGDSTYTGHICTVEEFLDLCIEKNVIPVLELKWSNGINNNDMTKFRDLAMLVRRKKLKGRVIFLTSMRESHEFIRNNYPEFQSQWLCNANWSKHWPWCEVWHLMPSISFGNFDKQTVDMYNAMGLPVACWTVDKVEDYVEACKMGVYMITTNCLKREELPDMPQPALAEFTPLTPVELNRVDPNETIKLVMGQELRVEEVKHGSVGVGYFLDCDTTYFDVSFDQTQLAPDTPPGGDKQHVWYTLRPRQKGTTVVSEIRLFRGDENRIPHTVVIE